MLLPSAPTRNVRFRYPARPDALVFRSFKLTVEAGTTVALVCTITVYNIVPPTVMTLCSVPYVYTSNDVSCTDILLRLYVKSCRSLLFRPGEKHSTYDSSFNTDVLSAALFVVVYLVRFIRAIRARHPIYTVCTSVRRSFSTFHAPARNEHKVTVQRIHACLPLSASTDSSYTTKRSRLGTTRVRGGLNRPLQGGCGVRELLYAHLSFARLARISTSGGVGTLWVHRYVKVVLPSAFQLVTPPPARIRGRIP